MKKLMFVAVMLGSGLLFAGHNDNNNDVNVIVNNPQPIPGPQGVAGISGKDGSSMGERTEVIGEIGVRLIDAKHYSISVFDGYDFRAGHNDEIGARLYWKLGQSYEERQIEELRKTIDELKTVAHRPGVHQENFYTEKPKYLFKKGEGR